MLKCTEERPVCAQCAKANRECLPASAVTFRHQQNPSMNGVDHGEGSLKNFYGYRETFGRETTWVEVPKDLTFVHTSNPYEDEDIQQYGDDGDTSFMSNAGGAQQEESAPSHDDYEMARQLAQAAYPVYATQGLEALSAVASRDEYSYAPPPAPMGQQDTAASQQNLSGSPSSNPAGTSQNLDFILNPSNASNTNIDPQLDTAVSEPSATVSGIQRDQNIEHVRTQSYGSQGRTSLLGKGPDDDRDRRTAVESPELAFYLRDFSEHCGLWMDLYDMNLFFATTVPVLAVRCPLLLYSCAALSAKSLARVGGRRSIMGGQIEPDRRSKMETWPGQSGSVDWYHKAREYYDLAVSLLRQALAGAARPLTASIPEHASPITISTVRNQSLPTTESDELVAATGILCVYEFIDASTPEWSRHLDGAKSLFDIANDRMVHLTHPQSPLLVRTPASHLSGSLEPPPRSLGLGRRAVFWCFARQDMLSAFINNSHTRLNTFDLDLWRSAGLKITPEGRVCPSNPRHSDFKPEDAMLDDMVSNALVWLIAKLVNFMAAGDDLPEAISPLGLGMKQRELLGYWEQLDEQLTTWFDGLPDSFHPPAVIVSSASAAGIDERWFPRPMCASTMQWWHFARIQLLHNKPHLTTATPSSAGKLGFGTTIPGTSLAARHASYASILHRSREHAKAIIAIGLGRSDEGARVNTVQPLWSAGLVLGNPDDDHVSKDTWMWRRQVLSLLRGTEFDLGWAAEYRVHSLLELWQLPLDWT